MVTNDLKTCMKVLADKLVIPLSGLDVGLLLYLTKIDCVMHFLEYQAS